MYVKTLWLTSFFVFSAVKLGSALSMQSLSKHEALYAVNVRNLANLPIANGVILNQVWILTVISRELEMAGLSNVTGGSVKWTGRYPDITVHIMKSSKILDIARSHDPTTDMVLLKIDFMPFEPGMIDHSPVVSLGYKYEGNVIDYGWARGQFNNEDKGEYWYRMFKGIGEILPNDECMKLAVSLYPGETKKNLGQKFLCTSIADSPSKMCIGPGAPSIIASKLHMIGLTNCCVNQVQLHLKFDIFHKWMFYILRMHADEWNHEHSGKYRESLYDFTNNIRM